MSQKRLSTLKIGDRFHLLESARFGSGDRAFRIDLTDALELAFSFEAFVVARHVRTGQLVKLSKDRNVWSCTNLDPF